MINTQNINEARKLIQNSREKPLIVRAKDNEFNRKILEYGKFDVLLALDFPLNHIMVRIAEKNKISIGLDVGEIKDLNKKEKALKLEKIIQNLKLCRKAKCKIVLINYEDKKDAFEFLISLGASTGQAKEAVN